MPEKGTRVSYKEDQMRCLSAESDHLQNGFCKSDLGHGLKINGVKKNGLCDSTISNGNVMNGQCLVVDGREKDGHWMVENGVTKTGCNENGHCGVVRRCVSKGGSSLTEEHSVAQDEEYSEQSTSLRHMSDVSENVQTNHIKVSFQCPTGHDSDIKGFIDMLFF